MVGDSQFLYGDYAVCHFVVHSGAPESMRSDIMKNKFGLLFLLLLLTVAIWAQLHTFDLFLLLGLGLVPLFGSLIASPKRTKRPPRIVETISMR